jgi:hypothetical protein
MKIYRLFFIMQLFLEVGRPIATSNCFFYRWTPLEYPPTFVNLIN